jgi:hypothetical protein
VQGMSVSAMTNDAVILPGVSSTTIPITLRSPGDRRFFGSPPFLLSVAENRPHRKPLERRAGLTPSPAIPESRPEIGFVGQTIYWGRRGGRASARRPTSIRARLAHRRRRGERTCPASADPATPVMRKYHRGGIVPECLLLDFPRFALFLSTPTDAPCISSKVRIFGFGDQDAHLRCGSLWTRKGLRIGWRL